MDPDRISEFLMNHWIISSAWVLVVAMLSQNLFELATRKYKPVSTVVAVHLINTRDPVFLDVREAFEYTKGHIQDSINIPAAKLEKRLSELEKFKSKLLIVACQTGTRSTSACKKLKAAGFEEIMHLTGGIQAWEDQKLPLIRKKSQKKAAKKLEKTVTKSN
ncbi:MAG: rhodanese-like domain-containing protein [Methylococcales bacterium]